MTIAIDATALILLSKVSILEVFTKRNKVIAPEIVYYEVTRGKEKGRTDSLIVEKLTREGNIDIETPQKAVKNRIESVFNLKKGELEVISLAYKTKRTILTDDRKCLNVAKVLGIGFITSLDVIIALYKKKAIAKGKALKCIDRLEEYGWYAKDLIEDYREAVK